MLKKLERIYDERIIKWFYILLPIVEVITTYMVINVNTSITVGMIYKTLFLLYGIIYLLFIDKVNKGTNYILLGIFAISIVFNFLITMDTFTLKAIMAKVVLISKYICFPIALMFLHKYNINGNKVGLKTLVYSSMLYATVMVIAKITGTELPTYASNPEWGHTGWFYSGNEISALMAMFYPITIYFCSKYNTLVMKYALVVVTYGLLFIGTKTSFVAVVITIMSIFIFETILYFMKKEELSKKMIFTSFILLLIVIITSPYSPSMKFIVDRLEKAKSDVYVETGNEDDKLVYKTFVFNGREDFIEYQAHQYKKAPLGERIFGMPDYKRIRNEDGLQGVVERDLYDILFTYGIFGFIVYFTPMVIISIEFAKKLFTNFKKECNEKNFVMGISICLSLGISYIAGHVLLAPTVALFLSVIFSKLNYLEELDIKKIDEKKMIIYMPKLSTGGMEMALINFLNISILRKKYDITLILGYCTDKELTSKLPKNIKVRLMCNGKWNKIGKIKASIKYIIEFINSIFLRYDISICYSYHHSVLSKLSRIASPNNIMFMHTDLLNSRNEEERNSLIKKVKFYKFKAIVCVSESAKSSLEKLMPNYKGKMFVANNYIDGEKILSLSKEIIDDFEKEGNEILFVNVSRHFEKAKKISRIIEASDKLIKDGYKFKVLLIGSGEDTSLYKNMIEERNLNDIVILKGNQINPYKYIKACDCLIVSSEFEGYGIVIDEARILNIPVISTDVADAKSILESGFGFLTNSNNSEGIYIAMKEFLNNGYELKYKFDYKKFNKKIDNTLLNVCNYCESSDD